MAWATATVIAVVSVAVAVASAASTAYVAHEQADAQAEYQRAVMKQRDKEIEENYKLSIASMHDSHKARQEQIRQQGEAASAEEQRNAVEAAKARATARTAAGEAGVAGLNVEALMGDFMGQEARYRYGNRRNLELSTDQLEAEMEGDRATAQGRVNAIPRYMPEPVSKPSYLADALRIGGAGFNAYQRHAAQDKTS